MQVRKKICKKITTKVSIQEQQTVVNVSFRSYLPSFHIVSWTKDIDRLFTSLSIFLNDLLKRNFQVSFSGNFQIR